MVLLKEIEDDAFVFYTNYESAKAAEIDAAGKAAFVVHWKCAAPADPRARDREPGSGTAGRRLLSLALAAVAGSAPGPRAQSRPLASRAHLMAEVAKVGGAQGNDRRTDRRSGAATGSRPVEIEFWADGAHRLHDRFRWTRSGSGAPWSMDAAEPVAARSLQ